MANFQLSKYKMMKSKKIIKSTKKHTSKNMAKFVKPRT
jgi:hypothetical protein